jgi:RNA polymerase sigma-70 factor (ECF subfamily)
VGPPTPLADYHNLPEDELQCRYHQGNPQALTELLHRHGPTLRRWARIWAERDENAVDDAMQDLWLRLTRPDVSGRYDPARSWWAWALRILHNIVRDLQRRKRRGPQQGRPAAEPIDPSPRPEEELQLHEETDRLQTIVRACLDAVPEARRTALQLWAEGMKYKDIAERLSIPIGTAASQVDRARKEVGDCLKRQLGEGGV